MKKFFINILVAILGYQVRKLLAQNKPTVVAVVGSIGKTSTKAAIARVLSSEKKVQWQEGNYNHILTVPLIFFGHEIPSLYNPFAWLRLIWSNQKKIQNYPYDVVVLEIGTDGPGQIAEFRKYLHVDIAVVTAIAPEHMEFFKDIHAVAKEELSVAGYSQEIIINADLCDPSHYKKMTVPFTTFGEKSNENQLKNIKCTSQTVSFNLQQDTGAIKLSLPGISKAEVYSATAATLVAQKLGLHNNQIVEPVSNLQAVSGRMQRLKGIKNSLIIDESYNASPDAVISALDSLYEIKATHKIALLGNMNELGEVSEFEHTRVGEYCDANQLDYVITLGPDANKYLAPAAESRGCKVAQFSNPYDAGEFIAKLIKTDTVVLVKGSQNNVYAEEAIKPLLHNKSDGEKLVRQSEQWLSTKRKNFKRG